MRPPSVGSLVHGFFVDYLKLQKQVQPATIRSYRDGLRLFLQFVARDRRRKITRLALEDLTFERALAFLRYLEEERCNNVRTRNQRLALLHVFFEYLAMRVPEMIAVSERVAAIPAKRTAPPDTHHLDREQLRILFALIPEDHRDFLRDRALFLFLYNTGARVQEVSELRVEQLDLGPRPQVRLHGKGDKWRVCPLWTETAHQLRALLDHEGTAAQPHAPVFLSRRGEALTRFGIYKIVRRHGHGLDGPSVGPSPHRVTPHVFRHTTAVHLLESGVEVNVIRGWLGHVSLHTTNRYAEVTARIKQAAMEMCEPPSEASTGFPRQPRWRTDQALLVWLESL